MELFCEFFAFLFFLVFFVFLFVVQGSKMGEVEEGYSKKPKNFFEILYLKWMQYTYAAGFR